MPAGLDKESLLQEYLSQLHAVPDNTKGHFAVGLIGLVGSGKTTVANELAARTGLVADSNDSIRRFLNKKGFMGSAPVQEILEYIGQQVGDHLLAQGVSYVIDADLIKFVDMAREKVNRHGARFYLVRVECPEDVIRSRIQARMAKFDDNDDNADNLSRATLEDFERRKSVHAEMEQPLVDFVFRTERPVGPQIEAFCDVLRRDGMVE